MEKMSDASNYIILGKSTVEKLLEADSIYIKKEQRKTKIMTNHGDHISNDTIKKWMKELKEHGFVQTHEGILPI